MSKEPFKPCAVTQPRMMRMKQLVPYTALSRAYIYEEMRKGNFPRSHKLSEGVSAWDRQEIDDWLDKKIGKK